MPNDVVIASHRLPRAPQRRQPAAPAPQQLATTRRPRASEDLLPGAKDADYGRPDAGIGARGPVRRLQADLAALGHFRSAHGHTGGYFEATTAAVKAFQREAGLPVTGKADGRTLAAIANRRSLDALPGNVRPVRPASEPEATRPAYATGIDRLRRMSREELARLGATDKRAFFDALRPSAEAAEREYGVPAEITLIQAALESGWGKHVPGGDSNNLFGVKGRGPAGSVRQSSWEANRSYKQVSSFAKYHDLHEAVMAHGKLFHNGYYAKAMNAVARGQTDAATFLRNIEGAYHQDGRSYTTTALGMMKKYGL